MKPRSLSQRSRARRRHAAGSTLPATMMVVAVILALISAASYLTSQYSRFATRQASKGDLLAAADAALEYAYSELKTSVAPYITGKNGAVPPASAWNSYVLGSSSVMASNFNAAYANSGAYAASTGVTCTSLTITAADENGMSVSAQPSSPPVAGSAGSPPYAGGTPSPILNNNVPGYPGWSGKSFNYLATATVASTGHSGVTMVNNGGTSLGDNAVTVKRYFQVNQVPLFQAAIFYENDLELHPGAKMVVTGLVHTNASFYALGILAQVQFMSNVSYVGKYSEGSNQSVTHGWDGSNGSPNNTPEKLNAAYYPYTGTLFPDLWADGQPSNTSTTRAGQINQVSYIDPFGGASQTNNGLHDIIEKPAAGSAYNQQVAWNNASLRIEFDSSKTPVSYTITDGSGNSLTGGDYLNVKNALSAPTLMTDKRETSTVSVTSLDMAKLAVATVPSSVLTATNEFGAVSPANGLPAAGSSFQNNFQGTVYIHDTAATGTNTRTAIRLVNGRSLGQNVTIVSDNGMYIQGDYNTGGTKASDVTSNRTGDNTQPQATGYNRHSSAVMADAVTILSNAWQDGNSGNGLSTRIATATTVNTAILAGDVPSNSDGQGYASGGAHNFPRFLEDWGSQGNSPYVNFTYTGSLVEAFKSEKFINHWQTNDVYHWPNRLWSFDTNFLVKQPPGVPTGIQFSRGRYERSLN